jgi:ribosome-binding protein aMBF1 (putative translation factor)
MSECIHCGATDEHEHGIVVGAIGELNESVCTVCRTDELAESTVLSQREAEVAAHKQITGASHETISDRIDLTKSTVDEYSRRMKEKVRKAAITTNELGGFR